MQPGEARLFYSILLFLFCCPTSNGQGLTIVSDKHEYRKQIMANPDKRMVELKPAVPGIVYDLRYATVNNFMHRWMYAKGTRTTFLRKPAVIALREVQLALNKQGLGIKVFDAYRPYAVSKKFWELVKDERYVANPAKGSNHNRGTAIDLTLVNQATGDELNMGTGFDNFTDSAHHSFTALPQEVLNNRKLLQTIMEQHGFKALDTEWWHYTYQGVNTFEILDIPFKKLLCPNQSSTGFIHP